MIPVLAKLWQKDQVCQAGSYNKFQASLGLKAKHYPEPNQNVSPPAVKGLLLAAIPQRHRGPEAKGKDPGLF